VPPGEAGTPAPRAIDPELLARHTVSDGRGDKDERGGLVVIGGEAETPGGPVLTALAGLRAGAGRAHVVTDERVATALAVTTPELRVSALAGPPSAPDLRGDRGVASAVERAEAVVVGPGCIDADRAGGLLEQAVDLVADDAVLLVDAAALPRLADDPAVLRDLGPRVVLVPNPSEAARLLGRSRDDVDDDPAAAVRDAVDRFAATVAVRGATTWIADPAEGPYVEGGGDPALGTAGSGDVLVGLVAGLAACGSTPLGALVWGVHAHAAAGRALATQHGGAGLLARELLDVIPRELNALRRVCTTP
jgi:hydroxyethylthiazole kinase-like uncharacterized protein yjeF